MEGSRRWGTPDNDTDGKVGRVFTRLTDCRISHANRPPTPQKPPPRAPLFGIGVSAALSSRDTGARRASG